MHTIYSLEFNVNGQKKPINKIFLYPKIKVFEDRGYQMTQGGNWSNLSGTAYSSDKQDSLGCFSLNRETTLICLFPLNHSS